MDANIITGYEFIIMCDAFKKNPEPKKCNTAIRITKKSQLRK